MMAATMATMATVEAARTTSIFYPAKRLENDRRAERLTLAARLLHEGERDAEREHRRGD
jgi:hypothetical protein